MATKVMKVIPKRLKVDVLANDIKLGTCGSAEKCAVARAAKRALKEQGFKAVDVSVSYGAIHVYGMGEQPYFYDLPKKASDFIEKFDGEPMMGVRGKQVKPITFTATL